MSISLSELIASELGCWLSKLTPYFPGTHTVVVAKFHASGRSHDGITKEDLRFSPHIVAREPCRKLDSLAVRGAVTGRSQVLIPKQKNLGTWRH